MKWVTRIEDDKSKTFENKTKETIFIASLLFISEVVLNTFMPFFFGYYLGVNKSILWFILFIPFIFFRLETKFNGTNIKINLVKRLFNK